MVQLKPFCAWRYNLSEIAPEKVIAPPYDVITPEEQNNLYRTSPYNVVRLILGKDEPEKGFTEPDKYKRAAQYIKKWKGENILIKDAQPSFYPYRQTFVHPETNKKIQRRGFFSLVKLEEFSSQTVMPHERTHAAPNIDRMNLIREVQGNLSPVFGLYEDKNLQLDSLFSRVMERKPEVKFKDTQDMEHELWSVTGEKEVNQIVTFFGTQSIMIADGHHRYETALAYRHKVREKFTAEDTTGLPAGVSEAVPACGSKPPAGGRAKRGPLTTVNGALASDFVMMTLVNLYDEGLIVLPTHRMVRLENEADLSKIESRLLPYFEIKRPKAAGASDWENIFKSIPEDRVVIGLQLKKAGNLLLVVKDEKALRREMPAGKPDHWYLLDVNIVSYFILRKLLNIAEDRVEEIVSYTRDLKEAIASVQKGKASLAVLLRAPDVALVKKVCVSGEVMPQKSTYFYPKLPSGLFLYFHSGRCPGQTRGI